MRRRLLIYPSFQLGLILTNTLLMGAGLLFVGIQVARAVESIRAEGAALGLPANHAYFRFLDMEVSTVSSYLVVAFILSFALSSIVTLVISNRLAGPIVRLRGYFRHIANTAKYPKNEIYFRKGDFFGDLPKIINTAFDNIHGKPRQEHSNVRHIGTSNKKKAA